MTHLEAQNKIKACVEQLLLSVSRWGWLAVLGCCVLSSVLHCCFALCALVSALVDALCRRLADKQVCCGLWFWMHPSAVILWL